MNLEQWPTIAQKGAKYRVRNVVSREHRVLHELMRSCQDVTSFCIRVSRLSEAYRRAKRDCIDMFADGAASHQITTAIANVYNGNWQPAITTESEIFTELQSITSVDFWTQRWSYWMKFRDYNRFHHFVKVAFGYKTHAAIVCTTIAMHLWTVRASAYTDWFVYAVYMESVAFALAMLVAFIVVHAVIYVYNSSYQFVIEGFERSESLMGQDDALSGAMDVALTACALASLASAIGMPLILHDRPVFTLSLGAGVLFTTAVLLIPSYGLKQSRSRSKELAIRRLAAELDRLERGDNRGAIREILFRASSIQSEIVRWKLEQAKSLQSWPLSYDIVLKFAIIQIVSWMISKGIDNMVGSGGAALTGKWL